MTIKWPNLGTCIKVNSHDEMKPGAELETVVQNTKLWPTKDTKSQSKLLLS